MQKEGQSPSGRQEPESQLPSTTGLLRVAWLPEGHSDTSKATWQTPHCCRPCPLTGGSGWSAGTLTAGQLQPGLAAACPARARGACLLCGEH